MRADVHEGREHMLQSEAGYIDARPHRQDRGNLLHRTAGPYIGVEEMRERPRVACQEDRFFEYQDELDEWEKRLTLARSLAPGDATLFEKLDYKPIDDPVEAVKQFPIVS